MNLSEDLYQRLYSGSFVGGTLSEIASYSTVSESGQGINGAHLTAKQTKLLPRRKIPTAPTVYQPTGLLG